MSEQYIERYWRDATPADAIREPPMVARFRDTSQEQWESGCLSGFDRPRSNSTERWWYSSNSAESFYFCQVYDAPDPGDGWRLIDTDKDKLQIGDEALLDTDDSRPKWERLVGNEVLGKRCIIRRRIEQPKPEPRYEPFRWEDREQLRGRWIAYDDGNFEVYPTSFFLAESTFFVGTLDAQKLVDHWRFLDTGEPVGRRVE